MPIYTVEIDGKQYDMEGDHPPSEAEARAAIGPQPGPVSRFFQPIGEAVKGMAATVPIAGSIAKDALTGNAMGAATTTAQVAKAMIQPNIDQARKGGQDFNAGRYSEAFGRGAAALLPIVGPAAADIADTGTSGNVAGALGKSAVLALAFAKAPFSDRLATFFKNREAARALGVLRPGLRQAATAEDIAPEVFSGVRGRETMGGLGVGTRATLVERAGARAAQAGKDVEALQSLGQGVDTAPISDALRNEATSKVTVAPSGENFTENPALVAALRSQADKVDALKQAFGGDVPAGELFKQRAVLGARLGNKAYEHLPGDLTPAEQEAGIARQAQTSKLLHEQIPGSDIPDHEYHVMANARTMLENSRLRDMLGRGGKPVLNLLAGRLFGGAMGGLTGYAAGGPQVGVAGAALGVLLGESALWGSMRAATYSKIAGLLKAGDIDGAANVVRQAATSFAISRAEQNRKAQDALSTQAQGSPAP